MNSRMIGEAVEAKIRNDYNLIEDKNGFDAAMGIYPIEIKACRISHLNGVDKNLKQISTKGRFWIDNYNHRRLLESKGIYIFAVYQILDDKLVIIESKVYKAVVIDTIISDGDNTKIRYDRLFGKLYDGVVL